MVEILTYCRKIEKLDLLCFCITALVRSCISLSCVYQAVIAKHYENSWNPGTKALWPKFNCKPNFSSQEI